MELYKQYKLNNNVAKNMKSCLDNVLSLANKFSGLWQKANSPMEEAEAKNIVEDMSHIGLDLKEYLTTLEQDISFCKEIIGSTVSPVLPQTGIETGRLSANTSPQVTNLSVMQKNSIVQEMLAEENGDKLVTLEEFTKDSPLTANQMRARFRRLADKGKEVKPVIRGIGRNFNQYNYKDLKNAVEAWQKEGFGSHLGKKQEAKKPTLPVDKTKEQMISLSDFVDEYDLDPWRKQKFREYLQQAYYDKAITAREERAHGPKRYFVYPVSQMELAAKRWADTYSSSKLNLRKKA